MNENECDRIANAAGIRFSSSIDIFYDKHFRFNENNANVSAADKLKKLLSEHNVG